MHKAAEHVRTGLAMVGLLAAGYWLGSSKPVSAAAGDQPYFELGKVDATSSLLVYQPANRSVYVYQGATSGSSTVQCSFKYVLGDRPDDPVRRVQCGVGTLR